MCWRIIFEDTSLTAKSNPATFTDCKIFNAITVLGHIQNGSISSIKKTTKRPFGKGEHVWYWFSVYVAVLHMQAEG